jgi:hypothetical protein
MGKNSTIFMERGEEGLSKVEGDYNPHFHFEMVDPHVTILKQ